MPSKHSTTQPFPLLGKSLSDTDYCLIDLDERSNPGLYRQQDGTRQYLFDFIQKRLSEEGVEYGLGGYAEKRAIYRNSPHFSNTEKDRCIHLGIDVWAEAGTPIYAPYHGKIHSFHDHDMPFNYGPVIILQHEVAGERIHSLHGHLSRASLEGLREGQWIQAGQLVGKIGDVHENGGWPPHLHFQLIRDMGDWKGDYFGACAEDEKAYYLENCPNGWEWI